MKLKLSNIMFYFLCLYPIVFIFFACAPSGTLKMHAGTQSSEGESIITIPKGIRLHRIDDKGIMIGHYNRNKFYMDSSYDRDISLSPGTHTIEFYLGKKEQFKISFNSKAGHKYRIVDEILSSSICNVINMSVMIQEELDDMKWHKMENTVLKFKRNIPQRPFFKIIEEIQKYSELSNKSNTGIVIFSSSEKIKASSKYVELGIMPLNSPNSENFFKAFPFNMRKDKQLHFFELPAGKYATIGFNALQDITGKTTVSNPYCAEFDVPLGKYVYLGSIEIEGTKDIKKFNFNVEDNIKRDFDVIKIYYPHLELEQIIVNILSPEI